MLKNLKEYFQILVEMICCCCVFKKRVDFKRFLFLNVTYLIPNNQAAFMLLMLRPGNSDEQSPKKQIIPLVSVSALTLALQDDNLAVETPVKCQTKSPLLI